MHWLTVVCLGFVSVTLCFGNKHNIHKLLDNAHQITSFDQIHQEEFVDYFSNLVLNEIRPKASKAVQLPDAYKVLRYGVKFGMKTLVPITMQDGVTSKPTFEFVNATIENQSANHIAFNTRVSFDNLRLTFTECRLNISGTSQLGSVSAHVTNFQGVFSTLLDFKDSGGRWLRRSKKVFGNVRETTNPDVELELNEDSTDLFDIYINMVEADDLKEVFKQQILHVFDVVILDHVDQLYESLKNVYKVDNFN